MLRHTDPKVTRIQGLPMFKNADIDACKHVASVADIVEVAAGQHLIVSGQLNHEAYVVESGTAVVLVNGEEVAEISDGEMIGELGLLDHGAATATVTTKTAMSLLVIPHNRFGQILDENPSLVLEMAKELAQRLRAMDARHH